MDAKASQITSLMIVYSTVYSDAYQRKHQCSASLAFVRGIHRWPVNSPHKWPVTRKMFPFDDVMMKSLTTDDLAYRSWDSLAGPNAWWNWGQSNFEKITIYKSHHNKIASDIMKDCSQCTDLIHFDPRKLPKVYPLNRSWLTHTESEPIQYAGPYKAMRF